MSPARRRQVLFARYHGELGRVGRQPMDRATGARHHEDDGIQRTADERRPNQGHNAYSQWGNSVARRGNQWAPTGHVTSAGNGRPMNVGLQYFGNVERPAGAAGYQLRFVISLLYPEKR